MDRDQLATWLHEGLSLNQIGDLVGRDHSTVGYWLKKHGLVANGREKYAARGELSREDLVGLINRGLTVREIADELDRSPGSVRHWLVKFQLKTRRRAGRRPMVARETVDLAIASGQRTVTAICPRHGRCVFVIESSGRTRCRQCRMDRVSARRRKVKRMLIEERGGCCVLCGYNRCVGALHFHHVDPSEKRFAVSRNGATLGIATLRAEAEKCVVLCANCHAEVEHGDAKLSVSQ